MVAQIKMTKFSENLEDIKALHLSGIAIKEVSSSIQFLTRLCVLDMSGCSKLKSLPEITVPMKSLQHLYLSKTGIKDIPSSFKHMISLITLKLDGTPIKSYPCQSKIWYVWNIWLCMERLLKHYLSFPLR